LMVAQEARAADAHDVRVRAGLDRAAAVAAASAVIPGRCRDYYAGLVEDCVVSAFRTGTPRRTDIFRADPPRVLDAGVEIARVIVVRLNENDFAVRADAGDHVEVERLLALPIVAGRRLRWKRRGRAVLVNDAQN